MFLESGKCFWILGSVLDSWKCFGFWKCFWILESVSDSWNCFGFWEVVLDSRKCFVLTSHRSKPVKIPPRHTGILFYIMLSKMKLNLLRCFSGPDA